MSKFLFECRNVTNNSPNGFINNISLQVGYSEIHALIVKNSSEQKVFIESIKNLLEEQTIPGEILVESKPFHPSRKSYRIGLLHQKPLLISNFSVAENLNLVNIPTIRFLPFINWRKIKRSSKDILNKLDFEIDHKKKVYNLSDEEKRIVYLASEFLQNPKMMIMHEPMEGLSAKNASKLYNIMKQFKEDGGSILYVTKQWEEALKLADRISILSNGSITDEMLADEAKNDPRRLIVDSEEYNFKDTEFYNENDTKNVLDAVLKAAEFLTSEYELKDVLMLLAKEVTRIMNADGCSIKLIDENTSSIIDDFEYNENKRIKAQLTKESILKIAKESDIFYVNKKNKEFESMFENIENVKTIICVPVLIRSEVTGIIQISYEQYYVYSKEESKYIAALARHAAIAIEDTRLLGRSTLLQESHHRIKNNLQSIVGLITLQKMFVQKTPDLTIDDLLDSIISRIKSIASVHNLLSKDKLGRSIINVKLIIKEIMELMNSNPDIQIHLDLDDILIPYNKATSIALIINELVMNCYKHAFTDKDSGIIEISCKRMDDYIFLSVQDNGRGFPEDFDITKADSLGLSILNGIVTSDFQGEINFGEKDGSRVEIKLPTDRIFLHS
ncbi:histidine kinase dimerization/phosphoacceptor domain -containing protein [Sutcliffiella sp. NC1]|uniref:histidine kinase dimerization/phosphoacceptor domain -containing protein n=1 Tax=Sutcliffiella sp. NC1 TaxID=3004096 RepID=UPI0022DD1F98|nr:histidine kinase dimerization/phosphoacceptor domain -containing protein [Sutcliffiella sp. NC1]WBL14684.1 ATP-binding cassette domain-containing protein [Sutcliffiella sp. NC1]